ncbi:hypothetical protein A3D84_03765 [Candidatus Woesebacteria bacterium RIFCSPHIGHO2_02_FULL_42_20]|uniref:BrnT family toxin n=1 Tax=Candidatus Woesebacteria bacterium RIFCSPHIGHO2_12_FULL_41_24 TaxID=1802510 RepID=A0A1F8AU77_9BACT|nr:MAG: hypothetical protein A2W15_03920 [Candidatus Woesebacteria bacterium RBG_16_41_13]OGM29147.1 MAG: hypothetical protein A2873_01400 [Candidatus Woesebacteria bacterium RIFCSPHIGHO2_01_FULL_42_80]OGM35650.1 MAG: hypothetical protein A3D84_03765 [Candidatus Woesebacteria bacterium RIFCSPHIGHO2_02_FULL_42_20]OGM55261.1 MAG: hypothetical protein A3E44_03175 [Candidatus Woesebacteria bacterium RIFCSPHIGHO2_12_FULL_41_24]OGM67215.1 MAG: hypothetical protein A2969_04900 [Candidatus Woesebacteri
MSLDLGFSKIEGFEWDEGNLEHINKHGVNFKECEQVFVNRLILIKKDKKHSVNESRFRALGYTNNGRNLFIAFTVRAKKIRVISARDQNRKEKFVLKKIGGERG